MLNQDKLIIAVENNNLKKVKKLVKQGVDIHARYDEAFCWAAYRGHLDIVKYFVSQGISILTNNNFAMRWAMI